MGEEKLVLEEDLELHKQRLILDMEQLISAVKQREDSISVMQKELNDTQWYLGEEKTKNTQLKNTLDWFEKRCQELEGQISQLRTDNEHLQKEIANSHWYLGEERAKKQELENRLGSSS